MHQVAQIGCPQLVRLTVCLHDWLTASEDRAMHLQQISNSAWCCRAAAAEEKLEMKIARLEKGKLISSSLTDKVSTCNVT